jgi:hypothetical protein
MEYFMTMRYYRCAVTLCKRLVDLGFTVSGNVYSVDRPKNR